MKGGIEMKRTIKKELIPIPQNLKEASDFLAEIGREQRIIDGLKKELNETIEKIKKQYLEKTQIHEKNISEKFEGLYIFAQKNRNELTENEKKKSIELPTGIFGWRLTPPSVSLKSVKSVLSEILKRGLNEFIRIKQEIDKEAMLKKPELASSIKGVSIVQYEEFFVKPSELEIEIKSDIEKLKKLL